MEPITLALILGALIGLILALTGAGGGVLAIPALVFVLKLPVQQAAPVGLVAIGFSSILGAILGLHQGIVRYRAAGLIGVSGMIIAPFGVATAQYLPNRPLLAAFAIVLMYSALRLQNTTAEPQEKHDEQPCRVNPKSAKLIWTRSCARALAITGMASGFLSGLLGVGGGFVIVPALSHHTNLDIRSVQATSLAVIALVSVSGVTAAALHGSLPWQVGIPFASGACVGLVCGRQFANRLDASMLRNAFSLVALLVSLLMFVRAAGLM